MTPPSFNREMRDEENKTMKREIKFRAWDDEHARMLEPQDLSQAGQYWPWLGKYDFPLMQFTGLLDKNGKEIYEGDVLQWPASEKNKGGVEWSDSFCAWMIKRGNYSETFSSFAYPRQTDGKCRFEIIGNIYENPELLPALST